MSINNDSKLDDTMYHVRVVLRFIVRSGALAEITHAGTPATKCSINCCIVICDSLAILIYFFQE